MKLIGYFLILTMLIAGYAHAQNVVRGAARPAVATTLAAPAGRVVSNGAFETFGSAGWRDPWVTSGSVREERFVSAPRFDAQVVYEAPRVVAHDNLRLREQAVAFAPREFATV